MIVQGINKSVLEVFVVHSWGVLHRNLSLLKCLYYWYETTSGVQLGASDLNTVNTILWKSDNQVSKVGDSWKLFGQFFYIKSTQIGLSGFL